MRALLINGSPHADGTTHRALAEGATTLTQLGIEVSCYHLGEGATHCCQGCGYCRASGRCRYEDDGVNRLAELCRESDGLLLGTPVHYAGASGLIKCVMGRLCYSAAATLTGKPVGLLAVCRRSGGVTALEELASFLPLCGAVQVYGNYYAVVHGTTPAEAEADAEGLQSVRAMAYALANTLRGRHTPFPEDKLRTPFIR